MDAASTWKSSRGVGARWSFRLFGGCDLISFDSHERVHLPGKRERVLLAYLAIHPNCRQTRRMLATLLWGDATDETALSNLRTCVWTLRKALGDIEIQFFGDNVPAYALSRDDSNDLGWSVMAIVLALVGAECFMAMSFGHYRRSGMRTAAA